MAPAMAFFDGFKWKVLKVLKVLRFDSTFGAEGCGLPLCGNEVYNTT